MPEIQPLDFIKGKSVSKELKQIEKSEIVLKIHLISKKMYY